MTYIYVAVLVLTLATKLCSADLVHCKYSILPPPNCTLFRLALVLKAIFHQCVVSLTCSQSNSDGYFKKQSSVRLATSI